MAMQQIMLVKQLIEGVVAKAQQTGTPIDQQALSEMLKIVQNIAGLGQQQGQDQGQGLAAGAMQMPGQQPMMPGQQ
jgi:hypothetical protein